jgi:uncharacterized membrane protein YkoI
MKNPKSLALTVLVIGAVGTAGISAVLAQEEEVSLDQVPAAVRTTIEEHAGDHAIVEIEREMENGEVVYEVEQMVNGQEVEFLVSASGEYLGVEAEEGDDDNGEEDEAEVEVAWDQIPKAVQDGLAAVLGGAAPDELTRELEGGVTVYEAEYELNGSEYSVEVSENGDVLESEVEIAPSSLPSAILERLAQSAPDAEIEEVELVTVSFYEVELTSQGKTHEVKMLANGQRLDDDD